MSGVAGFVGKFFLPLASCLLPLCAMVTKTTKYEYF